MALASLRSRRHDLRGALEPRTGYARHLDPTRQRAGKMVGPVLGKVPVTLPGHLSKATWHLKAGKYELFCSMPGHLKLGMHARLTVTRH